MAGARDIGPSKASVMVDKRSSPLPEDSLAIVFAVAGAISIPSAHFANSMCPIAASASASSSSVDTLLPDKACKVRGVINSSADLVITTRTDAPDFLRCLTISADL